MKLIFDFHPRILHPNALPGKGFIPYIWNPEETYKSIFDAIAYLPKNYGGNLWILLKQKKLL